MCNNMVYCGFCQELHKKNYIHACSMNYYYCSGCGQYVYGNHNCVGTIEFYPYPQSEFKHYKCPKCKGEFSEPICKHEIGGNSENTYHCPFCNKQMKGFNNQRSK